VQGAGTVAHLMNHFWPGVKMEGWELDPKIYPVARAHMGLKELEDSDALVLLFICLFQISHVSFMIWLDWT